MAKDTWFIDWEHKRINRLATEYEELAQTIHRALMTDRYYYPIYTWQYGSDLTDLVGTKNLSFMKGSIKKSVKDALKFEDRVINVDDVKIENSQTNGYHITVSISTTLGVIREELMYNV